MNSSTATTLDSTFEFEQLAAQMAALEVDGSCSGCKGCAGCAK